VILSLAMKSLDGPPSHGYFEPRLIERACYCGALALKRGENAFVKRLVLGIQTFEERYVKKYGAKPATSVKKEVWRWRRDREEQGSRDVTFRRDPAALASRLMNIGDIDAFIWRVWNEISPDSPRYDELTAPLRRTWIRKMIDVLNARIESLGVKASIVRSNGADLERRCE
jgi:hypothetical protein